MSVCIKKIMWICYARYYMYMKKHIKDVTLIKSTWAEVDILNHSQSQSNSLCAPGSMQIWAKELAESLEHQVAIRQKGLAFINWFRSKRYPNVFVKTQSSLQAWFQWMKKAAEYPLARNEPSHRLIYTVYILSGSSQLSQPCLGQPWLYLAPDEHSCRVKS